MSVRRSPITEFAGGFATLGRGFAFWRRRPRLMAFGLLPAAIVGALIVAAIVALVVFLDPVTLTLTGFAAGWDAGVRAVLRVLVAIALVVAVLALAARTFTAITLLVGTPFYDRIQDAAERPDAGPAGTPLGFWATTRATFGLILQSVVASIVVLLLGLIPFVGQLLAPVAAFLVTSAALTRELTLSPFSRRGLDTAARRRLRRGRSARSFGFGVAVQLCYLVPLGAVITMPAAVAGATFLAHDLLAGHREGRAGAEPLTPSAE